MASSHGRGIFTRHRENLGVGAAGYRPSTRRRSETCSRISWIELAWPATRSKTRWAPVMILGAHALNDESKNSAPVPKWACPEFAQICRILFRFCGQMALSVCAASSCPRRKKTPDSRSFSGFFMVGVARIELAAPAMSTQCSTTELHAHSERSGPYASLGFGASDKWQNIIEALALSPDRTCDRPPEPGHAGGRAWREPWPQGLLALRARSRQQSL